VTSINAIRFDFHSGAMVCDEQRHWNPDRLKIYAADKIRPVVSSEIIRCCRTAAAYGNTGTSGIGDELRFAIHRDVVRRFERARQEGEPLERVLSIEAIARLAFETILAMKHRHTDDHLLMRYGFDTADFLQGRRNGLELSESRILERAHLEIAWEPGRSGPHPVFGNGGILAGYDPGRGFQIYVYSLREPAMEPVHAGFVARGSGSDTANLELGRYFSRLSARRIEQGLDRVEALLALLTAVYRASQLNLGVGGYFNILLFDGRAEDPRGMLRQINDHRSRLCTEAVAALDAGLLPEDPVREIIDGLLFQDRSLDWAEELLWSATGDARALHRFLRGYPSDELRETVPETNQSER
jgi:hypothetical protein